MADGVLVMDAQQRIVDLNPAAQRIVGLTKAETVGRPYSSVLPGQLGILTVRPDAIEAQSGDHTLNQGQMQRYFGVYISPIRSGKAVSGHVLLLHDDAEGEMLKLNPRKDR